VVSITPRPLCPRERLGTHCAGGWVCISCTKPRFISLKALNVFIAINVCSFTTGRLPASFLLPSYLILVLGTNNKICKHVPQSVETNKNKVVSTQNDPHFFSSTLQVAKEF
jgi:hypothetical protein